MEYQVISSNERVASSAIFGLNKKVTEAIAQGWVPQGGAGAARTPISVSEGKDVDGGWVAWQAMVKTTAAVA